MDSTTLTRTLEIMLAHGWIVKQHGKDRRERRLRLSKAGAAQYTRALSTWQAVKSGSAINSEKGSGMTS